jgi:hypothetical protein
MWLSVLFDGVFGPDIVTNGVAGDRSTVPSAVVVALFAFLATWVVARYGFGHEGIASVFPPGRVDRRRAGAEAEEYVQSGRSRAAKFGCGVPGSLVGVASP